MKKDSTQIYQDDVDWNSPDKILMEKEEKDLNANEYRNASIHFLRVMSLAMSYIIESRDSLAAAYGVSYALGLNCADRSMRQVGRELNLSSGTISAHSKRFRLLTGLPPSLAQQPITRADNSRKAINKKLQ